MNLHGKDIGIFAANVSPQVAWQIADCLSLSMGESEVSTFSNGEITMSLFESVRGSDCFIVQSTYAPVNNSITELLIMIDVMKCALAARITAAIPYFSYARQDRRTRTRSLISAKLVADLITTVGADRILTIDLHIPQTQGSSNIPMDHLLGAPILSSFLKDRVGNNNGDYVVVSLDLGSVIHARNFAARIGSPLAIIDKRRQKANVSGVMNIIGDAHGKKVVLMDDMTDTTGTLCSAVAVLVEVGGAVEMTACATHGVLSGPVVERVKNSCISELILLSTVPVSEEKRLPNFTILPVAPLFAEAVEHVYEDELVSPTFV